MRCLITGCEGFIGSHLADLLLAEGSDICGMVYGNTANIKHLTGKIQMLQADLRDRNRIRAIVNEVTPDVVFHLAAQSFVTVSWEDPEETLRTNILGTFNLLEAAKSLARRPRTIVVGSSAIYGPCTRDELPLKEDRMFRPTSMYAVSKVGEDMLGHFYWQVYAVPVMRVRPFNMTGPRKIADACSDFARGIAEIELGHRPYLEVGNLDTIRDFSDGRDVARALAILMRNGVPGEVYNLCSGVGRRMADVLRMLIDLAGHPIEHRTTDAKLRPFDDPIYVGDYQKLRKLGYEPRIPFEETLADLLGFWRAELRKDSEQATGATPHG